MKKAELELKLNEIHQKLDSLGSLEQKLTSVQQNIDNSQNQLTQLTDKNKQAADTLNTLQNNKAEFEKSLPTIQAAIDESKNYKTIISTQKEEYNKFKTELDDLKNSYKELEVLAKDQLGIVSMESLANSFASEASKLERSANKWFWLIIGSTIILILAIFGVALWQVYKEQSLLKPSFAIRLPLVSPILYFLFFAHHQYSREKRLWEEYSFKASIARSFEAYRKVIKEEITEPQEKPEKVKFILETIRGVYSSPMINIDGEKDNNTNSVQITAVDHLLEVGKKVKDFFLSKN
jgi:hypothetical protein